MRAASTLAALLSISAQVTRGESWSRRPEPQKLVDDDLPHGGRRIPGMSFHRDESLRPIDFVPSGHNIDELRTHKARKRHEEMSEEEKEMARRENISSEEVCPEFSDRCFVPGLQISLMFGEGLTFCVDCVDPHESGSYIDVWDAHHGPVKYHVDGRLVISVPNDARSEILNTHQVQGNPVIVFRGGGVPLLTKINRLQNAGAIAVLIVDSSGECTEKFDCGRLGKRPLDRLSVGFASADLGSEWRKIHIPSVIVRKEDGDRLLQLMDLEELDFPELGSQHIVRESS